MTQNSILISGGSRGIGKVTAELLAANYNVFAPSSKDFDLALLDSIESYLEKNFNEKTSLKALVCNAGIFSETPIDKSSMQEIQKIIDINLLGNFRLIQKTLPYLKNKAENQSSKIIFVSSVSGVHGEANASAYAASKAGLIALGKSLAVELASDNIQVNTIAPGWVRTDMATQQLNTPEKEMMNLGATLQNRWIEPEEIAAQIQFLISDHAGGITGQCIQTDAGLYV